MGYYAMWVGQDLKTILFLKMDQKPIPEVTDNQPMLHDTPEEWRPIVKSIIFLIASEDHMWKEGESQLNLENACYHLVWSVFPFSF
jgi:hypothetical protein